MVLYLKIFFLNCNKLNDVYFDGLDRGLFIYLYILDFFYVSFLGPECITSLNHGC